MPALLDAKEIYVSRNASQSRDGSKQAPFASIQSAVSIMRPGDVCHIEPSVYPETVTFEESSDEDNPIKLRPSTETGEVIITGADPVPFAEWKPAGKNLLKCKIRLDLGTENQEIHVD